MAEKQKGKGLSHLGVEMCNLFCWVNNFQRNVTTNYELIFNGYEGKGNLLISRLQEGVASLQYLKEHLNGYSKVLLDMAKSIEGMPTAKQLEGAAVDTQQQMLADFYGSSVEEIAALTAASEAFKTQLQTLEQLQQELNENIKELTKKLNVALQKGKKDWKLVLSAHKELCKVIEPSLSRLQRWAAGRGGLDECMESGDPSLLQFKYRNNLAIFFESLDSIGASIKEIFATTKELDLKKVDTMHSIILFAAEQKASTFGNISKGSALMDKYGKAVNGENCWGEFCHNSDLLKDCGVGGEKTKNSTKGGKVGMREFEQALPPPIQTIIPLSTTDQQRTPSPMGSRLKNGEPQSIAFVIDVDSKAMIGWDKYCLVLSHFGFLHLYQTKKGKEWVNDSPEVSFPSSIITTELKKDKLNMKCKPKSTFSMEKNYTFRSKQNIQKFVDYLIDYSQPTTELLPFSFSSSAPDITPYPVSDSSTTSSPDFSSSAPSLSSSSTFGGQMKSSSQPTINRRPAPSPRGRAPPSPRRAPPSPRGGAPPPPSKPSPGQRGAPPPPLPAR